MPDLTPERWRQIEDLYQAARDRDALSRESFLGRACDNDQDLRRRVELMLAKASEHGQILDQPAAGFLDNGIQAGESTATPVAVGAMLGPYRIESLIGSGGMGKVFKARDTRLGRAVAIKVAHERFSHRFQREAQAVAALNHPNICQLYDIGPDYLVLEYVEGAPIAPTESVRKLLDAAVQLADGMAAAHVAGFVHRDLKPANVLVTAEGRVKILDFGLVKSMIKTADAQAATPAYPEPGSFSEPGTVAGTAGYMSPEQACGSATLDARTDQFSCGVILYEVAAGKRAFKRPSVPETLAAIVREEPEPLPSAVPAPLRWIIGRCLAKEPQDRYESSRDLFLDLKNLRDHLSDVSSTPAGATVAASPPQRKWPWAVAAGFTAGAVMAVAITLLLTGGQPQTVPPLRLKPFSFEAGGQTSPVWSPDGKAVAFAAKQKGIDPFQVYVRNLDSPVATQITRMPESALPIDWTSTGKIIFSTTRKPAGLWSISPTGGEPEPFLEVSQSNIANAASVSQDGSAVALLHRVDDKWTLAISSPPGSPAKPYLPAPFAWANLVISNQPRIRFSPNGREILLVRTATGNAGGLEAWLMPYPASVSNPPRRIPNASNFEFSWMPDNRNVILSDTAPNRAGLFLLDTVSGHFVPVSTGATTRQRFPAVSPDGTKLVFADVSGDLDIVSVDLSKLDPARPDLAVAAVTPLIATHATEQMPAWAAKDPSMVYVTDRNQDPEIWLHKPGQPDRPLVRQSDFPPGTLAFLAPSLSPDGTRVIYSRLERIGMRFWISAVAGGAPVRLLKDEAARGTPGSWSPDGVSYVYRTAPDQGLTLNKVKTTGQAEPEVLQPARLGGPGNNWVPMWSPAGDWILYSDNGFKLVSPDGKTTRDIVSKALAYTFSADGKLLYGVRQMETSVQFFSVPVVGGPERVLGSLGAEYRPASNFVPSLRLTLGPDRKSLTYSTGKGSSNLWLAEGLTVPKLALLEQLGLR